MEEEETDIVDNLISVWNKEEHKLDPSVMEIVSKALEKKVSFTRVQYLFYRFGCSYCFKKIR